MNRTTVDSNKRVSLAGGVIIINERNKEIDMPPKKTAYEIIPSYVDENGNIEIKASEYEREGNKIKDIDTQTITIIDQEAFKTLENNAKEKQRMLAEAGKQTRVTKKENDEHSI